MIYKFTHKRKNSGVVGSSGEHQLPVTESVLNRLAHIASRKVVHNYLGAALCLKHRRELPYRLCGIAVNRGIRYYYTVALRLV